MNIYLIKEWQLGIRLFGKSSNFVTDINESSGMIPECTIPGGNDLRIFALYVPITLQLTECIYNICVLHRRYGSNLLRDCWSLKTSVVSASLLFWRIVRKSLFPGGSLGCYNPQNVNKRDCKCCTLHSLLIRLEQSIFS